MKEEFMQGKIYYVKKGKEELEVIKQTELQPRGYAGARRTADGGFPLSAMRLPGAFSPRAGVHGAAAG